MKYLIVIIIILISLFSCETKESKLTGEEWFLYTKHTHSLQGKDSISHTMIWCKRNSNQSLIFYKTNRVFYNLETEPTSFNWEWVGNEKDSIQFNNTHFQLGFMDGGMILRKSINSTTEIAYWFEHYDSDKWDDARVDNLNKYEKPMVLSK